MNTKIDLFLVGVGFINYLWGECRSVCVCICGLRMLILSQAKGMTFSSVMVLINSNLIHWNENMDPLCVIY